jgi:hypothetical protein
MVRIRRMRWVGNISRMGKRRNAYRLLARTQKERYSLEDKDIGGRIILK